MAETAQPGVIIKPARSLSPDLPLALNHEKYDVISSDRETGVITAERTISGNQLTTGTKLRVNVLITETPTGSKMVARFSRPPRTFGSTEPEFNELKDALALALPEAELR